MATNPLFAGLEYVRDPPPFAITIFGVTGDLTHKKLMPALFSLYSKGTSRFKIVGFARRDWRGETVREKAREMLDGFPGAEGERLSSFLQRVEYVQSTFEDDDGYGRLGKALEEYQNRIYYLSTPPDSYETIIHKVGRLPRGSGTTRIVVEKPFGRDFASAQALNRLLSKYFREDEIFRIDHYLGKETVQNILVHRFGNGIFEPVWNSHYIDHVQITVAEDIGVGTRANYYEQAGTLRDMIQNHAFQLLSLTAMEPPHSLGAESIRDEKVKVLEALRPITFRDISERTVRGQYGGGFMHGKEVPAYREEEGVDPESRTETYVALQLFLDTWRWSGVPFYLRSGKRMMRKLSEISVHFRKPPLELFRNRHPALNQNVLIMRIQPEEGVTLNMNVKIPGYTTDMRPVNMDFAYGSAFGERTLEAYERLLFDVILGDSTLYTRRDEVEQSWAFITRILEGWRQESIPLPHYQPGSSGPAEARELLSREGRRWRRL
jgi:glucose-6-phosphate 1-dehydrogenase